MPLVNIKTEHQSWPEKLLILRRSGTQSVAMVTKLLSFYCGEHLVELYCKESNTSDTNWLRYLFHHIWSKFGWVYDVITWLALIEKMRSSSQWHFNRYYLRNLKENGRPSDALITEARLRVPDEVQDKIMRNTFVFGTDHKDIRKKRQWPYVRETTGCSAHAQQYLSVRRANNLT